MVNHVKKTITSKQAWDILKDVHETRNPMSLEQTAAENGKKAKHNIDTICNFASKTE